MKRKNIFAVFGVISCLLLSACANPSYTMVHPSTGLAVNCSASGWGWLGAPMALSMASSCVKKYEAVGYIKMDQYLAQGGDPAKIRQQTIPQAVFTTEKNGADIYSGGIDRQSFVKLAHTAPTTLIGPAGTTVWRPECYKAVKDGIESEMVCREQPEVMRSVHFVWK